MPSDYHYAEPVVRQTETGASITRVIIREDATVQVVIACKDEYGVVTRTFTLLIKEFGEDATLPEVAALHEWIWALVPASLEVAGLPPLPKRKV